MFNLSLVNFIMTIFFRSLLLCVHMQARVRRARTSVQQSAICFFLRSLLTILTTATKIISRSSSNNNNHGNNFKLTGFINIFNILVREIWAMVCRKIATLDWHKQVMIRWLRDFASTVCTFYFLSSALTIARQLLRCGIFCYLSRSLWAEWIHAGH